MLGPRSKNLATWLTAAAVLASPAAAQDVDFIDVIAFEENADQASGRWCFEVDLEGTGLTSATLDPPGGGSTIVLELDEATPFYQAFAYQSCEAEPPLVFGSLQGLLSGFPQGSYELTINEAASGIVEFDPVAPTSLVTVTEPTAGAVGVSSAPSVEYVHSCQNCTEIEFDIEDVGTDGSIVCVEADIESTPIGGTVAYGSFEPCDTAAQMPAMLPDGPYALFSRTSTEMESEETISDQDGVFDVCTGAKREVVQVFTVPEPGRGLGRAAVIAVLLLISGQASRKPAAKPQFASRPSCNSCTGLSALPGTGRASGEARPLS